MDLFETLGFALRPENQKITPHLSRTAQLCSLTNATKFQLAVDILSEIEMDGETAEYLLDVIGYKDQVFGQILRNKFFAKTYDEGFKEIEEYL